MVKIVEVDEHPDADEECYEIDPAEFAKKVNLKEADDVILVAATGKIKLEVIELEDSVKASSGVTHDSPNEFGAGDSMDHPYQIEEDEPILLQMEIVEDRFALDKSAPEFAADDNNSDKRRTAVTPYKIVVKAEPNDLDGVGHDENNHSDEMNPVPRADADKEGQFFHGDEDTVNVVSDKLGAKPSEPVRNNGVEVIADNLVVKCEPVDGDSVKGAAKDTYDHCLEMMPERKTFDEEDEDDFVIV
ncbi:hypothetical protein QOZ80_2BG0171350 [Eleusine coracana subsp. coracana]|nr:hypothetical protein QOZ80_2BG0171350 [Eleusine coracana subsp. coracana]